MAFNINEFKSNMNRVGGAGHTGLFQVIFVNTPPTTSNLTERQLSFFCKTVAIPGIAVNTATYETPGQRPKQFPVGVGSDNVQALFMLDSDHQIAQFLHSWLQRVVNYSTAGGTFAEINGQLPYEMGYKDDYSCRMIIRHYSSFDTEKFYEVILDKAYPVIMGDIDLDWANKDTPGQVSVAFAYDRIQYSGEKYGTPTTRLSRGLGLLDALTELGGAAQSIAFNLGRPRSVQDAINRFTKVKDGFDTITKFFG